ncbi:unnamed protein product [Toxocara canis]|uniref:Swi3 domain-containing protein n=1 Tax=Toxocara canis TaxID=6265 RepID=A0A183UDE3_TOXCA|nr:unnamed protein product [Toxocara canis]
MPSHREDAPGTSAAHKTGKIIGAREEKFNRLFQIYRKYLLEANKLRNREISVGDDYDEAEEERHEMRLQKLARRTLYLHKKPDEPVILNITGTGSQFLDEVITNHINQRPDGTKGFSLHGGERSYLTMDELKGMIEQLGREGKFSGCTGGGDDLENFLVETLTNVHMQIKAFLQQRFRQTIEDEESGDSRSANSVPSAEEADRGEGPSDAPSCSWEAARMKLMQAVASGSLLVDEDGGENVSTASDCEEVPSDEEGNEITDEEVSTEKLPEGEEVAPQENDSDGELVDLVSSDDEMEMNDHQKNGVQKMRDGRLPDFAVRECNDGNRKSSADHEKKFGKAHVDDTQADDDADIIIED